MARKSQKKSIKRPKREVICSNCVKSFLSSAPNAKYCSVCRTERFKPKNIVEKRKCRFCGNVFETTYGWAAFCNNKCRNDWHRKKMTEAKARMARVNAAKEVS